MSKYSDKILCNDCKLNYVERDKFEKYGKCLSCLRRETMARTLGVEYVKYVDLPQSEKNRLAKLREKNNKRNAKKKLKVYRYSAKDIKKVDVFLNKLNYTNLSFIAVKFNVLYNKFIAYCNDKNKSIIDSVSFEEILRLNFEYKVANFKENKYVYKGGNFTDFVKYIENMPDEVDLDIEEEVKELKDDKQYNARANWVYTPEIINEIKSLASEEITPAELRAKIIANHPDLNITANNFNNVMFRHKIPHRITYTHREQNNKQVETTISEVEPTISEVESSVDNEKITSASVSNKIGTVKSTASTNCIELDEDGDPIRLKPIKAEVVSILDEAFKEKNCKNQYNYTVTDYINMLEMFDYLASNIDGLIKCRDTQFNIINNYQFDIVHEMENELAKEGDTYLQDKMYVMRDYRRYMEIDYVALKTLRPILKLIRGMIHPNNPNNLDDPKSISGCVKALKQTIQENAQPKFIPRVDVDMSKKYDWALNKNSIYKKAIKSSENVTKTNNKTNSEVVTPATVNKIKETINTVATTSNLQDELNSINKQLIDNDKVPEGLKPDDTEIRINASLKSLQSNIRLTKEQIKQGFDVYRVSCRISGGGFGVFKAWFKDYACVKEEIAKAFAQQEFARLKSENKGLLITEIECHKLNVN